MKKIKNLLIAGSILSTLACASIVQATNLPTSQNCQLGNTCLIPGDDGGQTHFVVTPATGTSYACKVKSDGGSLKFSVTSGKDFKITEGKGLYNANPESTLQIKGRFKNPDDANAKGEIRFTKLPLSVDGSVTCIPQS